MFFHRRKSAVLSAALITSVMTTGVSGLGAFQSGPNVGALYAGGISFLPGSSQLMVTGITYDNNGDVPLGQCACFIARFDADMLQNDALRASLVGSGQILEACHSVSIMDNNPTQDFVVAGHSDPGGMYGFADVASGFLMAMQTQDFSVVAGTAIESTQVSYPISIIADSWAGVVYVASLTSTSLDLNPSYNQIVSQYSQPNWLKYRKYGTSFEMTLEKVNFDGSTDMTSAWSTNFPIDTDANGDKPDVYLGGMILKQSTTAGPILIVAGSTRGMGTGYGAAEGNDEDGYISVINPTSGTLLDVSDGSLNRNNVRIGTAQDDIIGGICDDPTDPNSFYIVGGTKGSMATMDVAPPAGSLSAYVQKVSLSTLSEVWTVQWGALSPSGGAGITTAVALECMTTMDGLVYVAGVVQGGAAISQQTSKGGDDIFVAQLTTLSGSVNWIQQLGSEGNEYVGRGEALALDSQSDLVVFGDTDGNFYRYRDDDDSGTSDVFLVTLDKADGSYPPTGDSLDPVPTPSPAGDGVPTQPAGGPGSGGVLDSTLGVQSGPSAGALFSGGMILDPVEEMVYMTGITYDMNFDGNVEATRQAQCFIASASLDDGEVWDWENSNTYGDSDYLEACNTIALHRISELVVVGSADRQSSLLSDAASSIFGQMAGFALAVDRETLGVIDSEILVTTDPTNRYEYPISVVSSGSDLYIIALTSTDAQFSDEYLVIYE
jgi:hypothetical protein